MHVLHSLLCHPLYWKCWTGHLCKIIDELCPCYCCCSVAEDDLALLHTAIPLCDHSNKCVIEETMSMVEPCKSRLVLLDVAGKFICRGPSNGRSLAPTTKAGRDGQSTYLCATRFLPNKIKHR
jgi:hypothetical protein